MYTDTYIYIYIYRYTSGSILPLGSRGPVSLATLSLALLVII